MNGVLQSLPVSVAVATPVEIASNLKHLILNYSFLFSLQGGASGASSNAEKVDGGNDSSEEEDEEEEPDNLVVCQYDEKVRL